ncbi:hypothetical protein UlMin_038295 [Ulmus minor]
MGFDCSKADNSLFMKTSKSGTLLILIYVDDIIITGSNEVEIEKLVAVLNTKNQSPSSEISSPPSPSKPGFTQQVSLPEPSAPLPAPPHQTFHEMLYQVTFLLKIMSFSMLSKASIMKYRSSEFEAGGYKWILSVYPIGNKTKDAQDHISIYLELADTTKLGTCWEINSTINFFIYDHVRDKYVSRQDAKVKRFHCMKTQWGIPKFIDHETFNNPSNGYLVNDSCTFGVEVFIVKNTFKVESISMIRSAVSCKYSWKFDLVSRRTNQEVYESKQFFGADYKWSILFLPNGIQGDAQIWNNYITVGLKLDTSNFPSGKKLFTHFTLRMKDQINNDDYERSDTELISLRVGGFRRFMALTKFRDPEKGFLVNDACIVEAEFEVLGIVTVE